MFEQRYPVGETLGPSATEVQTSSNPNIPLSETRKAEIALKIAEHFILMLCTAARDEILPKEGFDYTVANELDIFKNASDIGICEEELRTFFDDMYKEVVAKTPG